jgi:hypothetical protein
LLHLYCVNWKGSFWIWNWVTLMSISLCFLWFSACKFKGLLRFFWIQEHQLCYLWEKLWWFGSKSCCPNCSGVCHIPNLCDLWFPSCFAPNLQEYFRLQYSSSTC